MSRSKLSNIGNGLVMLGTAAAIGLAGFQQYRLTQRVVSLEQAMNRRPAQPGSLDAGEVTARLKQSGQLRLQQDRLLERWPRA